MSDNFELGDKPHLELFCWMTNCCVWCNILFSVLFFENHFMSFASNDFSLRLNFDWNQMPFKLKLLSIWSLARRKTFYIAKKSMSEECFQQIVYAQQSSNAMTKHGKFGVGASVDFLPSYWCRDRRWSLPPPQCTTLFAFSVFICLTLFFGVRVLIIFIFQAMDKILLESFAHFVAF